MKIDTPRPASFKRRWFLALTRLLMGVASVVNAAVLFFELGSVVVAAAFALFGVFALFVGLREVRTLRQ